LGIAAAGKEPVVKIHLRLPFNYGVLSMSTQVEQTKEDVPIYEDDRAALYEVRGESVPAGQEYVIEHQLVEGRGERSITRFQFDPQAAGFGQHGVTEVALLEMLRHRVKIRFGTNASAHMARALTALAKAQLALTDEAIFSVEQVQRNKLKELSALVQQPH